MFAYYKCPRSRHIPHSTLWNPQQYIEWFVGYVHVCMCVCIFIIWINWLAWRNEIHFRDCISGLVSSCIQFAFEETVVCARVSRSNEGSATSHKSHTVGMIYMEKIVIALHRNIRKTKKWKWDSVIAELFSITTGRIFHSYRFTIISVIDSDMNNGIKALAIFIFINGKFPKL